MLLKLVTCELVATVGDDPDRWRYRHWQTLARSDSVGKWNAVLDEVLTGPALQFVPDDVRKHELRDLTAKCKAGTWQHQCVLDILRCLSKLGQTDQKEPSSVDLRSWFHHFATLRNKTRGHGATLASTMSEIIPCLQQSLALLEENFAGFRREWAYLHRNLSGLRSCVLGTLPRSMLGLSKPHRVSPRILRRMPILRLSFLGMNWGRCCWSSTTLKR
jgi:hypothetical protein